MIRSIFATIIFLAVTIVLSLLSIPAALFDRSGRLYLWMARVWGKLFLLLYGAKLEVRGMRNVHKNEHYVFAANHSSYTDIPILFASLPKDIRLILRHTLTRVPIWGWALYFSPMIIINRSNASKAKKTLARAAQIIHTGGSVLLFPEGTRTHTGNLQPFKRGAFHLALQAEAKVIPVAIIGSFEFLPRTKTLPASHKKITVIIGEALESTSAISGQREQELEMMRRVEDRVRDMLA